VAGHRARAVELVHRVPCKPAPNQSTAVWLWAVNIGCATASAFPVEAMLPSQDGEDPGACGDLVDGHGRCRTLAGFTCRVRELRDFAQGGFHARCASDRDPFQVLELDYEY
jgi:hypothetical protein